MECFLGFLQIDEKNFHNYHKFRYVIVNRLQKHITYNDLCMQHVVHDHTSQLSARSHNLFSNILADYHIHLIIGSNSI